MALAYKCHSELSGKFLSGSHRTHRAMPYFSSFHVGMGSMSMNDVKLGQQSQPRSVH